jgi:hypothetical protein
VAKPTANINDRAGAKTGWPFFAGAAALIGFLVLGIFVYLIHIERDARQLVSSVREVRTTEDAQQVIASWKKRSGSQFWQESDHVGGDHNYDAQVDNGPVSLLHIVEPTAVTVGFTMHNNELRSAVVIMTTGRKQAATSSVWVQEWFEPDSINRIHVVSKDRPWRATVEFPSTVEARQREKAFAFNTKCLIRLGGCKSAEDILPAVWQLETSLNSGNILMLGF